ncbi:MAG: AmmeMemoRadiSam system protein B [Acidobacteriota bacterium]
MKEKIFAFSLIFIFVLSLSWAQGIRKPVWAGKFYDSRPEVLSKQMDQWLEEVECKPEPDFHLKAIMAPHAGYVYSGKVAAYAYKQVQGKSFDTVVVIGPSHHFGFRGCSIYSEGKYASPLGLIEIDQDLAKKLSRETGFGFIPKAHEKEHSIEVQIPFIQKTIPDAKIIPVVTGIPSKDSIKKLSEGITAIASKKKVLIVVSTDMSHYLSKREANKRDENTIHLILTKDIQKLESKILKQENILCGGAGVLTALQYASRFGETHIDLLHYDDSSSAGGSESQVVGYMAAAVYIPNNTDNFSLSQKEKRDLLNIARSAIQSYAIERKVIFPEPQSLKLYSKRGAFVTLKRNGRLRGCMGFVETISPLYTIVAQAAVYAAFRDTRFKTLSKSELEGLEIEISVLTRPQKIQDISDIEVGRHGLIISKDTKEGLLLPQVAAENNWSKKKFLEQTCVKAGLPKDSWKKGADVYIFEAKVFH